MLTKNLDVSYRLEPREPGYEALAAGPLFAPDITGDPSLSFIETSTEVATGEFLTYSLYTATLAALDTVEMRRSGLMSAAEQRKYILDRTWESTKSSVPKVLILAAVLGLCPWLGGVALVGSVVGTTFMATRIIKSAVAALSTEQVQTIKDKAAAVGVTIPGLDTDVSVTSTAAGYDDSLAEPSPA